MSERLKDMILGCLMGGAVGDAWGSGREGQAQPNPSLWVWGGSPPSPRWQFTDDTQLTACTCRSLLENLSAWNPGHLGKAMLHWHKAEGFVGLGSSTLQSLGNLEAGIPWEMCGSKGERSAGNGAAMRMAPLAFVAGLDRDKAAKAARLTHQHDEAVTGALAVWMALRGIQAQDSPWSLKSMLEVADQLPDTQLRDRMRALALLPQERSISDVAEQFGSSGFVVESVPFALWASTKLPALGMEEVLNQVILAGGDTDTNAHLAGQLMGCQLGLTGMPTSLVRRLEVVEGWDRHCEIFQTFAASLSESADGS